MGRCIIKIKDKYFEWSTVVDAPVTRGMTERQLTRHIKAEYGNEGLSELHRRLERVAQNGTSFHGCTLDKLIELNRAGDNETCLTLDEIYEKYK